MTAAADRHLLFGLLALQNGLIDQSQLVAAFHAWTRDKARPLADHLIALGHIDADGRGAVEAMAALHLKKHGGDVERSLAAVPACPSTRKGLAGLDDPDIEATLGHVGSGSTEGEEGDGDADRTGTYSVGSATSDGQRFRVLRPHAKGGLGAVFVAMDGELNREVALKQILDHHADDPTSRRRFLVEAEITGGLEHPGIVPVYGLGTYGDGRPYYAMRFIRGDSLKDAIARFHADGSLEANPGSRSLALRKLLRRFVDVCNAVQYAHSRGVLHRDIKPGNVIVGKHGETLLVDWGLAKAKGRAEVDDPLGERPLTPSSASGSADTLPGSALGTPAYMSPEQAAGRLDILGPRSDVYSLGATLYSLLTGTPPFEGDGGGVLQAVQRGEFPPPRQVDPSLDRALEAVCLKAMALRPEDRHASCRALADDVERWAADEPVSAYAEPWGARARRWARRHHTAVVTSAWLTAASVVTLACGLVLLQAKQRETEGARREAVASYEAAVLARKDADAARKDAEADFARALDAVDAMLVRVSQKHLVNLPHFEPVRRRLLEDALTFYQRFLARGGDNPRVTVPAARAYRVAGDIHSQLGQLDLARRELDRAASILDRAPAGPDRDFERASVLYSLSGTLYFQKREHEAVKVLREGLALLGPGSDPPPGVRSPRAALLLKSRMLTWTGASLSSASRFSEAREAFLQARSILERLLKDRSDDEDIRYQLSVAEHNTALVDLGQADYAAGLERVNHSLRLMDEIRAASPDSVNYRGDQANSFGLKGQLLERRGRIIEAVEAHRRSIVLVGGLVADYPSVVLYRFQLAASHHNMGESLARVGRYGSAEDEFRRSIEALDVLTAREPESPLYLRDKANSHMYLAFCLKSLRRFEESGREFLRARELFTEVARLRPDDPVFPGQLAAVEHNRAEAFVEQGRTGDAESGFRRSIELLSKLTATTPANPTFLRDLANSRLWLGRLLTARGARDQGDSELSLALKTWDDLLGRVPRNAEYLAFRARTLLLLGRFDDAVSAAEALAGLSEPRVDHHYDAACALAFALPRPGDSTPLGSAVPTERAAEFADRAMRHLRRAVVDRDDLTQESLDTEFDLDALRGRPDFPALYDLILDRGFPADPFVRAD